MACLSNGEVLRHRTGTGCDLSSNKTPYDLAMTDLEAVLNTLGSEIQKVQVRLGKFVVAPRCEPAQLIGPGGQASGPSPHLLGVTPPSSGVIAVRALESMVAEMLDQLRDTLSRLEI